MSITLYVPTNEESDRFLTNVEKWIQHLRKQNVSADIAAYIARDFLSPMRIRPLDGDSPQNGSRPPDEMTTAVSGCVSGSIDEGSGNIEGK